MIILQCDFDKYTPEMLNLIADQIRATFEEERVLVIPMDVNFIQNLTIEQLKSLKQIFEKELEERQSNDL